MFLWVMGYLGDVTAASLRLNVLGANGKSGLQVVRACIRGLLYISFEINGLRSRIENSGCIA